MESVIASVAATPTRFDLDLECAIDRQFQLPENGAHLHESLCDLQLADGQFATEALLRAARRDDWPAVQSIMRQALSSARPYLAQQARAGLCNYSGAALPRAA